MGIMRVTATLDLSHRGPMADPSNARAIRTLALDTSHFGQFILALNSRRADERRQAAQFEAHLDAGAWVLALRA